MAYPSLQDRDYSYTAFQAAQGDNSFPGTQVDNDLGQIHSWADLIEAFLRVAHGSDGNLRAGSVNRASLSTEIQLGISNPTPWVTATAYVAGTSAVTQSNSIYVCAVSHTSGVFATDLAAAKWTLVAAFSVPASPPTNSVETAALQDGSVTTPKLADSAVTAAKVADATLTPAKAALSFGHVPVGGEIDYGGWTAPAGWLFCYGQAINRVTYGSLFATLTKTLTATRTSASNALVVAEDLTAQGFLDAVIEGTGIPTGTTITAITVTGITMSAVASSSGSDTIRILPYGQGDGNSTFNTPDRRGRVTAGRDDMGGTAANRLTSPAASRLSASGGAQTHTLDFTQMPTHSHTPVVAPHTHGITDPGHAHEIAITGTFAGSTYPADARQTAAPASPTSTETTGITVDAATVGITIGNTGSGGAHNNVQPTGVANRIIFAGV